MIFRLFFEEKLQFAPVLPSTYRAAALSPPLSATGLFAHPQRFRTFDLKQQRPNRCRWPMVFRGGMNHGNAEGRSDKKRGHSKKSASAS